MSCCGRKRQEWLNENKVSSQNEIHEAVYQEVPERKTVIFEYKGTGTRQLSGAITGNIYQFNFPGDKIEIAYEDSFAMMAENNLNISRR